MLSSTAYYIKFDGFSPTFFNQFLVVVGRYGCLQVRTIILEVTGVSTVPTSIGWRLAACNILGVEETLTRLVET
jgi:hypothetical protein